MTDEKNKKIHASLDAMLENPKAKNFLNHLVRAYMPVSNVTKVMAKPSGDFKCALTRDQLISTDEILQGIYTDEFKENLMTYLKSMFDENADKTTPVAKLVGEKKLGVTGKDTTTFMSLPAYHEFLNWVMTKSLKGDKHINWLLGGIRRESFIKRAEAIQDADVQKKLDSYKKKDGSKAATFTLGDSSDVLSKLKAQLESKGK